MFQLHIFPSYITLPEGITISFHLLISKWLLLPEPHRGCWNGTTTASYVPGVPFAGAMSWHSLVRRVELKTEMLANCQAHSNFWRERSGKHRGFFTGFHNNMVSITRRTKILIKIPWHHWDGHSHALFSPYFDH